MCVHVACVFACVCPRLVCARVPPCRTLIGLDGLGKVTSLPDCVDFPPPRGQTQRAGVKRCSTLRWKGNQRSALCSRSAMITPSPLSTTDTAEDRGHCLCTSVVLILNFHRGILFSFFSFRGHILKSENI